MAKNLKRLLPAEAESCQVLEIQPDMNNDVRYLSVITADLRILGCGIDSYHIKYFSGRRQMNMCAAYSLFVS